MKITCPEHRGLIYVDLSIFNEKNKLIKKVVECPVCDDEVVINGLFDFDSEGIAAPVNLDERVMANHLCHPSFLLMNYIQD